ncbi:hypothetical protein [Oligoflexus tunisiensis]|uniref:hypothetical protein n=1 Tax=Oligoflexus tunisiensis TaxID=708132 RepID=UPI00114C98E9|nr:hypothetical protein [Oligoflexus tunisiensis]
MTSTGLKGTRSFYSPPDVGQRDAILHEYARFLEQRNGGTDPETGFVNREAWLESAAATSVRHRGEVPQESFERNYVRFNPGDPLSKKAIALLAFTKVNAGEAYGVEVISRSRHARPETSDIADQVERVLTHEEIYHTKILLGAARQFDLPEPVGAWKPPVPLKLLINVLAHSPRTMFHPILLGSEFSGVFAFQWLLNRIGEVFRDEPELRDSLEQRLIEILIDEVGHVAFNRIMVGSSGLKFAHSVAAHIAEGTSGHTPEFRALGWDKNTIHAFDHFDYMSLPDEVRSRAFFA